MKFIKTALVLSVFSCFIIGSAYSQTSDSVQLKPSVKQFRYPNIIKLNSFALAFSNISLIYEKGIVPRVSAGIGVAYKHSGTIPSLLAIESSTFNSSFDQITGVAITPEVRYYLRACDPGKLEGFYTGVYFRYQDFNTTASFEYTPVSSPIENYFSDVSLTEFGVGIQLGYQMIIKERFSIDFLFIGPRVSGYKKAYEFDRPPSDQFLDDLSGALNEVIDRLGFDYEVDIEGDGDAKASSTFSFVNARIGLSLGYTF
ncbi:MAG: DUF3575 domain-containing protein [Cyclobacteriaceae bacterium]